MEHSNTDLLLCTPPEELESALLKLKQSDDLSSFLKSLIAGINRLTGDVASMDIQLKDREGEASDEAIEWRQRCYSARKHKKRVLNNLKAMSKRVELLIREAEETHRVRIKEEERTKRSERFLLSQHVISERKKHKDNLKHLRHLESNSDQEVFMRTFKKILRKELGDERYMQIIDKTKQEIVKTTSFKSN